MSQIKKESISSIRDIGLMIQSMIKNRFNKNVQVIYTGGTYNSLYVSFYKNHVWQFFVQDRNGKYTVSLIKDDKLVKKDDIYHNELVSSFYRKIMYFFSYI